MAAVTCLSDIQDEADEGVRIGYKLWLLTQVQLYPVIPVAKEKLVDTNGAGDAFVGGEAERLQCPASTCLCMQEHRAGYIEMQGNTLQGQSVYNLQHPRPARRNVHAVGRPRNLQCTGVLKLCGFWCTLSESAQTWGER